MRSRWSPDAPDVARFMAALGGHGNDRHVWRQIHRVACIGSVRLLTCCACANTLACVPRFSSFAALGTALALHAHRCGAYLWVCLSDRSHSCHSNSGVCGFCGSATARDGAALRQLACCCVQLCRPMVVAVATVGSPRVNHMADAQAGGQVVGHMLGAGRLTIHSSRRRFAARLNSGVRSTHKRSYV